MTAILAENDGPTIIILQSDHGHSFFENEEGDSSLASIRDRAGIFNAYYLPEHCRDDLYPSITPINTFRVVFNCQFNGDFQLLEDITWYGEHGYLPIEEVIPGFYE